MALKLVGKRYTDTKLNGLFRAPARVSVIKLVLARNTISFCGLNKLFAIARSSPGIFENLYCVPVPRPWFSQKFPYPDPEYSGIFENDIVFLFPDRNFLELFPFPAWNISEVWAFPNKKNCHHTGSIHWSSDNQADVLPLHHQFI